MSALDFEGVADAANKPEGEGLKKLQTLIDEVDELDANIEQLEEMLKSANTRYNLLKTSLIPALLAELQTNEWTNEKGTKVKISGFVSGSLPKEEDKRKEAIAYMETLPNGADMIKTTVTAEFPKRGHNEALALAADLRGEGYLVTVESGVHASSLQANMKERLAKGENVDLEKLGLFAGRTAKITHKRKKAGSK